MRVSSWIVAGLVGLGSGPGCAESDGLGDAEVAYVEAVDGVDQIWVMRADGRGRQRLTSGGGHKAWPTWSPDGRTLVFVEHVDGGACNRVDVVWRMDGGGLAEVAALMDVRQIAADAGGEGLFVVRDDCAAPGYFAELGQVGWLSFAGGELEPLAGFSDIPRVAAAPTPGRFAVAAGEWMTGSADSADWTYRPSDVEVGERGSLDRTVVAAGNDRDAEPTWHPDGARVTFVRGETNPAIYTVGADGIDTRRETPIGAVEQAPAWSPDGETLLAERLAPEPGTVLRDADGERLLEDIVAHDWSPDGASLFVADPDDIIVLDVATGTTTTVGPGHAPTWRP